MSTTSPNEKHLILIESINNCLLPKLDRNFEESDKQAECEVHKKRYIQLFKELTNRLGEVDLEANLMEYSRSIACLFILYTELKITGQWRDEVYIKQAELLSANFQRRTGVHLAWILRQGDDIFDRQAIFDHLMEELHLKLTPEDFKKYPGLIDAYCLVIKDLEDNNIIINPVKVFPIALLLADDYVPQNRQMGLECVGVILKNLPMDAFKKGNYYDVIYITLCKSLQEREPVTTNTAIGTLMQLLICLPSPAKEQKTDETYAMSLEQAVTESNVYRKIILYRFAKKLITMLRSNCIKRRIFHPAIVDGLMMCSNEAVQELLTPEVLDLLEEWIKHSWIVWNLQTDYKILSELMKLQCVCKPEQSRRIVRLIATIITICTEEEQMSIVQCLEQPPWQITDHYTERVEDVHKYISLSM